MVMQAQRLRPGGLARALQTLLTSEHVHLRCQRIAVQFSAPRDALALCREIEHVIAKN
jgi:hypothetical protein